MIIHTPETRRENGKYIVSARLEYDQDINLPSELWFSVDEELDSHVSVRADIFLGSLIRVAKAINEDVHVRGELSPQLLFGFREYLKIHAAWSGNYDNIKINADKLVVPDPPREMAASCNISGGIDSFFTLWSQLPENEPVPELQVKYGIFSFGGYSPLRSELFHQKYVPRLKKMTQSLGVELLVVDTNIPLFKSFDSWLPISSSHIALPLLFSPLISIHYIPGSISYHQLGPWGAHPMTDHLFSIESLRIFTHGSEYYRFEKLREIVHWEPMYEYLQVCNNKEAEELNDCTCRKCLRTMMMLEVLGISDKITTFQLPIQWKRFAGRVAVYKSHYLEFKLMAKLANLSGKRKLLPIIYLQMLIFNLTNWLVPFFGYKWR